LGTCCALLGLPRRSALLRCAAPRQATPRPAQPRHTAPHRHIIAPTWMCAVMTSFTLPLFFISVSRLKLGTPWNSGIW
jgi:hypothetical protein